MPMKKPMWADLSAVVVRAIGGDANNLAIGAQLSKQVASCLWERSE